MEDPLDMRMSLILWHSIARGFKLTISRVIASGAGLAWSPKIKASFLSRQIRGTGIVDLG